MSNNNHLLNYIKNKCDQEKIVNFGKIILKQKAGRFRLSSKSNLFATRKDGYVIAASKKNSLINFYNIILPKMTLDRKKEVIYKHFELFKSIR